MLLESKELTGEALQTYRQVESLPTAEELTQLAFLPQPILEPAKRRKSRKKKKSIHASMLHPVDAKQKARAKMLCGAGTIYNAQGALRMYCGRRDCPYCFKRRYKKIANRIRRFKRTHHCKLYWTHIESGNERLKLTRRLKRNGGDYICFPAKMLATGGSVDVVVSNVRVGRPVHLDAHRLESSLAVWTDTRPGAKVSFSSGFKTIKSGSGQSKINFMAKITLPEIIPHAMAVGADIKSIFSTYIHWEVDVQALTKRLNKQNVMAFQLTLESVSAGSTDIDAIEANDLPDAVALDHKGRVIKANDELRHIYKESYGTTRHQELTAPIEKVFSDVSKGVSDSPG